MSLHLPSTLATLIESICAIDEARHVPFLLMSRRKREHTSDESLIAKNWLFVPG
jgi:hypothetical protein